MDNLFEIISWFPAKEICKIKTICKSFSQHSKETHFKTKQAINMLSRDDTCFIIQPDEIHQMLYRRIIEVHPLPREEPYSGVSHNFMGLLSKAMRVLASNNGLLLCRTNLPCLYNDQIDLYVCNPVTQSFLLIPNPCPYQGDNVNVNIVLECYKDGYDLILFEGPLYSASHTSYICKVYQSKECVWKTKKRELITGSTRSLKFEMSVIHNGVIYFISDTSSYLVCEPYIVSYDLESGMSTMVKLPDDAVKGFEDASCNMGIFTWGKIWSSNKSICLVRSLESVFTVWLMENDGEGVRWRRVLEVRVKEMGLNEKNPEVNGFMVMNGDLLIFATESKIYSCRLSGERYMEIEEICNHNCASKPTFISYSNTLRPVC